MESPESKALSVLEALEARSLTWGFVDQSLSEEEAEAALVDAFAREGVDVDASELLGRLCDLQVVRKFFEDRERRYRTRLGETLRLLQRLRQWFTGRPWQSAPALVSDYRFDIRPRRYPARTTLPAQALETIRSGIALNDLQLAIWNKIVSSRPEFTFAEFQIEATRRILSMPRGSGTVVSAGTGSGKTLAFYLPAVLMTAPELATDSYWTKVVCIYPRQELLKDQMSEAFTLARVANTAMAGAGRRKFVIGSLFSATPTSATPTAVSNARWRSSAAGPICPFLRCPICTGETFWPVADLVGGRERLRCRAQGCDFVADESQIRLTRASLTAKPADFLFTTTEMINQRLSDTFVRKLFGVRQESSKQPLLTLLDEVHTYSGISGAQTALVFRRWTALLGSRMRWTALSATLPSAEQFFSDLTGVRPDNVAVISPRSEDMSAEGAEYQIILRTDPASQTATVSTSIQSIMLLSRMLDPQGPSISGGLFGSKIFVFTDDLDVNNRIYDNLHDAEAYFPWRQPDPARQTLASLRASAAPDAALRESSGQRWQMAESICGNLGERLRITRTNSRDPGVAQGAQVVVATSSLEVGFNDTTVGAVIQHKAPRSSASFLQRRGRAGRDRQMRPITVTVLSDYGRDRVAFQSYEHLFDPTLDAQRLPLNNGYVQRIQAVLATLDWIAFTAPQRAYGWTWRDISAPDANDSPFLSHVRDQIKKINQLDPDTLNALKPHLRSALAVNDDVLDSLLWLPPRSLLLEVLPTAARRLFRNWKLAHGPGHDLYAAGPPHPLPDFVPGNLFADLMLPEVAIKVPDRTGPNWSIEYMPILSALQQFTPGRVRRRFADGGGHIAHWAPVTPIAGDQTIPVASYCPQVEMIGTVTKDFGGVREEVAIYRPWEIQLGNVPATVAHASNATWQWQTHLDFVGIARQGDVPTFGGLTSTISRFEFWLHRAGGACAIRRFTLGGVANLQVNTQDVLVRYGLSGPTGERAAIGFAFEADAITLTLKPGAIAAIDASALTPELLRWLRYLALRDAVLNAESLPATLNYFRREWLHLVVILAGIIKSQATNLPIKEALSMLRDQPLDPAYDASIDILVNGVDPSGDDDADGWGVPAPGPATPANRLPASLRTALQDDTVRRQLLDATLLWLEPTHAEMNVWLRRIFADTVGQVFLHACVIAAPSSSAIDSLVVDTFVDGASTTVVVSETTLGGGGTAESIADAFVQDPRQLTRCMESAAAASDHEVAADAFQNLIALVVSEATVAQTLADLRNAATTDERDSARAQFFDRLKDHGIPMTKTLGMMIGTRLARPGASTLSDELTNRMVAEWDRLEVQIGLGLPVRLAVAAISRRPDIRADLKTLGGTDREFVTGMFLVWPRGGELRQRSVQSFNPYVAAPFVDTALIRPSLFENHWVQIAFGDVEWCQRLTEALVNSGGARLHIPKHVTDWKSEVQGLLATPISSGYLQFYPMIESVRALGDVGIAIDLVLRERV